MKDPCKTYTEQELEAKSIMERSAINTCPRRRRAFQELKKYATNHSSIKVKSMVREVHTILKDTFPNNPHHEDYR